MFNFSRSLLAYFSRVKTSRLMAIGFALVTGLCVCSTGFAQIDLPPVDQGQPTEPVVDPAQDPVDNGNTDGGGGGAGPSEIAPEAIVPIGINRDIDDLRNQGFVGPTGQIMNEQGFVGAIGETAAPPISEGRSLGGNVNGNSNTSGLASNPGSQENGFRVTRRSIRAKLVPSFSAPRLSNSFVESRFVSRMSRQPVVNQIGQGLTIRVANKTATITGVANSAAELRVLENQLRLEPGVYKIDNRAQVGQANNDFGASTIDTGSGVQVGLPVQAIPGEVVGVEPYYVPNGLSPVFVEAPRPPMEGAVESTPTPLGGGF